MKFYLSSMGLGSQVETLKSFVGKGTLGFIPNASDHYTSGREENTAKHLNMLTDAGFKAEVLDLRDYYGKSEVLRDKLSNLAGVWVKGGNTFVLRQAMKLSGFDEMIHLMSDDFVYGGFSAGCCVLAPRFDALQQVDDPSQLPYSELQEQIWEGLGLLPYIILPHYKSDNPESPLIDKEVEYCKQNGIAYKTLRDGEVIIL